MIANIDDNIGALDTFLEETGLRDNTILIFATDNGGTVGVPIFNAGMRSQKASIYEGGHRVPCFIRWPAGRLRPPGGLNSLTQCQDIVPTLVEFCGLKVGDGVSFDGASLAQALRGKAQLALEERMLVVQYGRHSPGRTFVPPITKWDATVLWNRWRLVNGTELYDIGSDSGQDSGVGLPYAYVVEKMRYHYELWWNRIQSSVTEPVPIVVGSSHENPTRLTGEDWFGLFSYVYMVRQGVRRNGYWNIFVDETGEYEISLRRWPEETNAAICGGLPPYPLRDKVWGSLRAGKPLPIARARLKVGLHDASKPVRSEEKAISFRIKLRSGSTKLQTWFYDASDQELCGAWYTHVERL